MEEGIAERGKGVGARWVGQGGWAKGGRVRGARGWNLYFNEVFNKTASTLVYYILRAKAQYIATVYANNMGILTTWNVYHKISFKKFP